MNMLFAFVPLCGASLECVVLCLRFVCLFCAGPACVSLHVLICLLLLTCTQTVLALRGVLPYIGYGLYKLCIIMDKFIWDKF